VGNVRELKAAVEFGIAFRDEHNVIHGDAIDRFFRRVPAPGPADISGKSLRVLMKQHEAEIIRQALAAHDNNVSKTADALDLSRQQLHTKIKDHGIVTRDD
jgi:transcriptional regulator with PAS, ATPase and Fis domain